MKKASVIMVDCDMYVGAQQVLEFCAPLIKDKSAVIFDDWHSTDDEGGEKRAFREFLAKYPDFQIKEELQTYDENARVVILERKN